MGARILNCESVNCDNSQIHRFTVLYSIHTLNVYSIACLLTCNCAIIDAQNFVSRRNSVKGTEC